MSLLLVGVAAGVNDTVVNSVISQRGNVARQAKTFVIIMQKRATDKGKFF